MNPTTRQVMRQWTLAQPVIASYITALVRDFAVRDDLLQDVAVAVLESVDRYDPSKPFIGWAIGITRNILRNHFRRHSANSTSASRSFPIICSAVNFLPRGISCPPLICVNRDSLSASGDV